MLTAWLMYNDFNSGCLCKNENGIALYHSYGSISALLNNKKLTILKISKQLSISEKQHFFLLKPFECPFVLLWHLYFSFNNVLCQKRFESRTLHWLQVLYKNMSFTQNPCNKVPRFFEVTILCRPKWACYLLQ